MSATQSVQWRKCPTFPGFPAGQMANIAPDRTLMLMPQGDGSWCLELLIDGYRATPLLTRTTPASAKTLTTEKLAELLTYTPKEN